LPKCTKPKCCLKLRKDTETVCRSACGSHFTQFIRLATFYLKPLVSRWFDRLRHSLIETQSSSSSDPQELHKHSSRLVVPHSVWRPTLLFCKARTGKKVLARNHQSWPNDPGSQPLRSAKPCGRLTQGSGPSSTTHSLLGTGEK
jgi:hypothetical protein